VGLLSSVTRGKQERPFKVALYSGEGLGKTTFASAAPGAVILDIEAGSSFVDCARSGKIDTLKDATDFLAALESEPHEFKTVAIDTLDALEPLIWKHVCEMWTDKKGNSARLASIEDAGYGKGYVEALGYWRQFFDGITALRDQRNMTIVMIAHSQVVKVEDPTLPSYDTHDIKLHKRAAALAEEYADVILYAQVSTNFVSEDLGFNNKRQRAVTTGQRVMHTVGQPAFLAKNRYSLPSPLPLAWEAFASAMWPQAEAKAA